MTRIDLATLKRSFFGKIHRLVSRRRYGHLKYFLATHLVSELDECPANGLFDYALSTGDEPLALACLHIGALVDREDDWLPPLYYALKRADADLSMLDFLIERGVDPNVRFMNDLTPLHDCAFLNKPLAAQRLLAVGADPNAETRIDDYSTPLMEAASRGHEQMVTLLLESGATPQFVNRCGQSAISVAPKQIRGRMEGIIASFINERDRNVTNANRP